MNVDAPTQKLSMVIGERLRPIASAVSRRVAPPTWMTQKGCWRYAVALGGSRHDGLRLNVRCGVVGCTTPTLG